MRSPLLMFAICNASARHLTRLSSRKGGSRLFEVDGIPLPDLDEDSAIHYHDACISYLVSVSHNSEQAYNEDTLAAATALRYYEQIDSKLSDHEVTIALSEMAAADSVQHLSQDRVQRRILMLSRRFSILQMTRCLAQLRPSRVLQGIWTSSRLHLAPCVIQFLDRPPVGDMVGASISTTLPAATISQQRLHQSQTRRRLRMDESYSSMVR